MKRNIYNIHFKKHDIPDLTIRATSERVAKRCIIDIIRGFYETTGYDAEFSDKVARLYEYTIEMKGAEI